MIQHLAFVMDGNRRWAKRCGLMPWDGHKEGVTSLRRVVDFCIQQHIPHVSFYTFSLENFKRSEEEKNYLFDLIAYDAERNLPLFLEKGACIKFVGDRSLFPERVKKACDYIEQRTRHLDTIQLHFLVCYGARQEIVDGVKVVAKALQEGRITHDQITDELFAKTLWMGDAPNPDVIVRTGGAHRLSNFLLYQAAYSELMFLDCMWPEIQDHHLHAIVERFEACQRNFGI